MKKVEVVHTFVKKSNDSSRSPPISRAEDNTCLPPTTAFYDIKKCLDEREKYVEKETGVVSLFLPQCDFYGLAVVYFSDLEQIHQCA